MSLVILEIDDQRLFENHGEWAFLVKLRAGWHCEECGVAGKRSIGGTRRLDAHHLNGDPTDNRLANGQALCASCHRARHPEPVGIARADFEGRWRGIHTDATKVKIAASVSEHRANNPAPVLTVETRQVMSEKAKARVPRAGWHHTEETRAKMRASHARRRAVQVPTRHRNP